MTELEAMEVAMTVVRRKLAKCGRAALEGIVFEGQCGPGDPGWEIRENVITVPMPHLGNGPCFRFRLQDLAERIDSPQGGLFA